MSGYEHPDLVALDEIEDLLEAYAEARLAPRGPILARMRRAVLAQAALAAATRAAERRVLVADVPPTRPLGWSFPRLRLPRAAFALGFSGILVLGTSAAVLAAPPGSAFYNARVALEQAFLPSEIDARLAAHEEHLSARLVEAQDAAARGDAVGVAAALAAYQAEVEAAFDDLGDNADLLVQLEAMLGKHVAVLEALEARLPEQASVDRALESSQKAIVKIKEKAKGQHARPSTAPDDAPSEPGGGRP